MTTTTKPKTYGPGISLVGANLMFAAISVKIHAHELGHYWADYRGQRYECKRLMDLCQILLKAADEPI